MINPNTKVVPIDHGWANMKTEQDVFTSGVSEITTEPALFNDVLEYNKWMDEENRVYIVYSLDEIQSDMNVSKHKAVDRLAELENVDLIVKRKRGKGLPNQIYVKNFSIVPVIASV